MTQKELIVQESLQEIYNEAEAKNLNSMIDEIIKITETLQIEIYF